MTGLDVGRWQSLLACGSCRGSLEHSPDSWACPACGRNYPILAGRPVFRDDPDQVRIMPVEHISNQLPPDLKEQIARSGGLTLNLGAGGTAEKVPNCVEFEYSIFRHTDVVGDAHNLPFADGAFDRVISFNTFEHLYDPPRAAEELFRVLKPGGRLTLQTAFLQPLHEPPHHYYNTTEFGLRRWFRSFRIEEVRVTPNFNPAYTLSWLSAALLWSVGGEQGAKAQKQLSKTTLGEWAAAWADPAKRSSRAWEILARLSEDVQRQCAAGFQIEAVKPD